MWGLVRGLVRGRHKARPLQLMWIYGLSVVRMSDDSAVGVYKSIVTETAAVLRQLA